MPPARTLDLQWEEFSDTLSELSCESEEDTYGQSKVRKTRAVKGGSGIKAKSRPTPYNRHASRRGTSSSSVTLVPDAPTPADSDEDAVDASKSSLTPPHEPITVCGIELRPTVAFDTFWRVCAERKAMDDRRRAGLPAPWTDDPILRDYHFCNTFRVLDKVCQYMIKEVIQKGSQDPTEVVFRVVLFDLFTKIDTWELLQSSVGPVSWKTYNRDRYIEVLGSAREEGVTLYTGAFIKPAPKFGAPNNFTNHLYLLETFMDNKLAQRLLGAQYMDNVYEYLRGFHSMGPFTAYQLMIGLSYTNVLNFHANDFVVAGPGSVSGANKLFGEKNMAKGRHMNPRFDEDVMRYMAENQDYHFKRLGLKFSGLGPKKLPMSVVDIEHMLCEVDKYSRKAHPRLKGKRTNLDRKFNSSGVKGLSDMRAVIPKAWSNPARREPRIRPERELHIDPRYVIDRIVSHKDKPEDRFYCLHWVGYSTSDDSWEWRSSLLDDAPTVVHEYEASLPEEDKFKVCSELQA